MAVKTVWRLSIDENGKVKVEKEKVETQTISDTIEDLIEDIRVTKAAAAKK